MPRERILPRPPHPPSVRETHDHDMNPPPVDHSILNPSLPLIQQNNCFLFTIFPPEIRNRIYTFSLESEDIEENQNQSTSTPTSHLYRQNAFYYRPGSIQPTRIATSLLQTCQQIYTEASLLPPLINKHTFWFFRGPPEITTSSSPLRYFSKMSRAQRDQVHHIHLFTQQYFLEDSNKLWSRIWEGTILDYTSTSPGDDFRAQLGRRRGFECGDPDGGKDGEKYSIAPKKLTITFRHTDWWFWENDEPLGINPFRIGRTRAHEMCHHQHSDRVNGPLTPEPNKAWGNQFIHMPTLSTLTIEFETIMRKRDQLDAIIDQARHWKFPLQPEKSVYLVAEPGSRSAWTWVGAKEGDLMRQPVTEERRVMDDDIDDDANSGVAKGKVGMVRKAPVLRAFDARMREEAGTSTTVDAGTGLDGGESDTEEFYVVFLTWKRQVVDE